MVEVEWDERLFEASCAWIARECTAEETLAEAAGISDDEMLLLTSLDLVPAATYEIYPRSVASPVAFMGRASGSISLYYGPAVLTWLRRCAAQTLATSLENIVPAMRGWLRKDLASALSAEASLARRFGWAALYDAQGQLKSRELDDAVGMLWAEWLGGGWAVCLNRFDGHHVVVKDLELERIPALAEMAESDPSYVPDLIDAMSRFDAATRAFAPFERRMSSRSRVIDATAARSNVPWPRSSADGEDRRIAPTTR